MATKRGGDRNREDGKPERPNETSQNASSRVKMVLLGEMNVGKSSLVLRFVKGQFPENLKNTIGAAFLTQTIFVHDTEVNFEIWDTSGQERFIR